MIRSLCQAIQSIPSAATEGRRKIIFRSTAPDSTTQAAEGLLFKDTPLGRLPSELLHSVFAAAGRTDIPNLRLTCRTLRDIGCEHLVKDITLLFNSKSFNRVAELSKHPVLSKSVQILNYRIDSLRRCRPVDVHRAHFPNFDMRTTAFVRRTRQGRALNRQIVRSGGPQPTPRQLKTVERKYFALMDDQDWLREVRNFASEELTTIIGRLSNLKHIAISNSHDMTREGLDLHNIYASDNPYQKIAPDLNGAEGLRAAGHLNALLRSFDRAGTKLESFSFGFIDWRIFEDPNMEDWELALRVIQTLKCIKIRLFLHCHGFIEFATTISCRELFKQGRPLTLLRSMPFLTNLEVCVKSTTHVNRRHDDIDLILLFGTHTWSRLHRFAVHLFITTQADLLGFFDRHSRSLRVVELTCGVIRQGSWAHVFRTMRRSMKLDDCKLSGLWNSSIEEDQWGSDTEDIVRAIVLGVGNVPTED